MRSVAVGALNQGLDSKELYDVYLSAGVVTVVKCKRLGWAECVARMDVT